MSSTVSSVSGEGGVALHLMQQAAEAREADRSSKAATRGHGNTKTSDAFEEIGRIIDDIDDTKKVRFKTPWQWQKDGIPAEVTDLRALIGELNRRNRQSWLDGAPSAVAQAKRNVEFAEQNIEYAEMDYQASNGALDGRADAAKGLEEAKLRLKDQEDWLKTLKDPSYDPERYAIFQSGQIRALIIVGDRIAGHIAYGGYVANNANAAIPGYNGREFAESIGIPWQAGSNERADAVVAAMAKLLGKHGMVFDAG